MHKLNKSCHDTNGLTQKYIGTAYDNVKLVADNLDTINKLVRAVDSGLELIIVIYEDTDLEVINTNYFRMARKYKNKNNFDAYTDYVFLPKKNFKGEIQRDKQGKIIGEWKEVDSTASKFVDELTGSEAVMNQDITFVFDAIKTNHIIGMEATDTKAGIVKLYVELGDNTDGTITQKALTEIINLIQEDTQYAVDTANAAMKSAEDALDSTVRGFVSDEQGNEVNKANSQRLTNELISNAVGAIKHSDLNDLNTGSAHTAEAILDKSGKTQQEVNDATGYGIAGSFADGLANSKELTSKYQLVLFKDENNNLIPYFWDGDLPKTVDAGTTPQSTGGIGKGAWVNVGDASLRSELKSGDGSLVCVSPHGTLKEFVELSYSKLHAFITIEQFGGDTSGIEYSDEALKLALKHSADNNVMLVLHGLIKLRKTVYQPDNSSVDGTNAIVFCEDPTELDDATLWKVDEPISDSRKIEIRKLVLSTSPSIKNYEDRLMKGLHVNTSRVNLGTVLTFGFQLGGIELGSKGYEITWDLFSCTIKAWAEASKNSWGVALTTTDNKGKTVITQGYPRGVAVAGSNHINTIHVWGFPATTTNEYPNRQLLTGVSVSNDCSIDYVYIDSPDTDSYDAQYSGNDGVGIVFPSRRAVISNLFFRLHPQTKPEKVKLIKYDGPSNTVLNLNVQEQSKLSLSPLVYSFAHNKYQNRIDSSNVSNSLNKTTYTDITMAGLETYTGSMSLTKVGRNVEVSVFLNITSVDNSKFDVVTIDLPDSLKLTQGYAGAVMQSSCIDISFGHLGMYVYVDASSKLRIGYTNSVSGVGSFITADRLKAGLLEFKFTALNAFEM